MMNAVKDTEKSKVVTISASGHPVTISFADEYNPHIANIVKNALIDSYIRKNIPHSLEATA